MLRHRHVKTRLGEAAAEVYAIHTQHSPLLPSPVETIDQEAPLLLLGEEQKADHHRRVEYGEFIPLNHRDLPHHLTHSIDQSLSKGDVLQVRSEVEAVRDLPHLLHRGGDQTQGELKGFLNQERLMIRMQDEVTKSQEGKVPRLHHNIVEDT